MQRITVYFTGRVQGVGFRATVARIAREYAIVGRVCNLTDGRVQLQAEGQVDELNRFVDSIHEEMKRYITHRSSQWSPAAQAWTSFEVAADQ